MTMFAMIAVLVGATLGLRFKMLVLVPAILVGMAATLAIGLARDSGSWSILLSIFVGLTALQIGYFGGAFIRVVIFGPQGRDAAPQINGIAPGSAR